MFGLTAQDSSLFTGEVVANLRKISAGTVLEFLETKTEDIVRVTSISYCQVNQLKEKILQKYTEKIKNGVEVLNDFKIHGCVYSTGMPNLDNLLKGGFHTGSLYELCGLSSTGKSQICVLTIVNVIKNNLENPVFVIDSKRDLSLLRITSKLSGNVLETLKKLQIARPNTPYELLTVLHNYIDLAKCPKPGLLFIDSLATLFFQCLADQTKSISLLSNVKSLLNYIAVEMNTAVVLTNILTWQSDETSEDNVQFQKAALGKFWSHAPTTRINTSRLSSNRILVTVTKSSNIAIGTSTTLDITGGSYEEQ